MADISAEIAAFQSAVYGEDVRTSMVNLANKVNNESSAAAAATADGSVTTAKLADGAVSTAKLADGSVTLSKLGNDIEITPPDGSITDAKLVQSGGVLEKVNDLKSSLADISIKSSKSKNLIDTSDSLSGYIAADGNITSNNNYITCPVFPIVPGKNYVANTSLRSILFYDANMQPMGDSYKQYVTQTVVAPPNSHYMRVSIVTSATNTQLEEGTTPTEYTPFVSGGVLTAGAYFQKSIDIESFMNTISLGSGKNKFDINQSVVGFLLNANTGVISVNANQATSNFIPIAFGMTLCISGVYSSSSDRWPATVICFYDQNQKFTRGISITDTFTQFMPNFAFSAERGERFFRVSYRKTNTNMQVEYAAIPTAYEAFVGETIIDPMLLRGFIYDAEPPEYANPWYGKKIIADGDSISHDQGGNNYWQFCTAKTLELDYKWNSNYNTPGAGFIGIAGSRIADENGGNDPSQSIVLRYTNYPAGADIVIIAGGSNDWAHSSVPLGESNSTDISTFNGALNVLLPGLKEKYPAASIVMMTPIKRGAYGDTNTLGLTEEQFANALIAKCREYGVYCCDMWGTCPINPNIPAMLSTYYGSDNVHPNPAGQAVMGKTVTGFVRTLA